MQNKINHFEDFKQTFWEWYMFNRNAKGDIGPVPLDAQEYAEVQKLYAAFVAGGTVMAKETLCTLSDWSAAVGGLDPELITPAEIYERVETNLQYVYKRCKLIPE